MKSKNFLFQTDKPCYNREKAYEENGMLYLIRHGESTSNVNKTFTGQQNAALTELGHRQAACIQSYFLGIHIDRILSSDLSRAVDTAMPLSRVSRVPIETMTALREIYGGKWEGEKFDLLEDLYPQDYALWRTDIGASRPTEGESIREVCQRVCTAVEEIVRTHPTETIVIATHACPIRAMLTKWLTGDVSGMQEVPWVPNASITKVAYENGEFKPVEIGITSHLQGMVTNLPTRI
jgi:broad specificity phosphatase PhoE